MYKGQVTASGLVELKLTEYANDSSTCTREGVSRIHGHLRAVMQFRFNDASAICGTKCTAHGRVVAH